MRREITLVLNQRAIEDALGDYVAGMGISLENSEVNIELTAGRGVNGHSAQITIAHGDDDQEAVVPSGPVKRDTKPRTGKKTPVSKKEVIEEEQTTEPQDSQAPEEVLPEIVDEVEDELEMAPKPTEGKSLFGS